MFQDKQSLTGASELDCGKLREIRKRTQLDFGEIEKFAESWAHVLSDDQKALAAIWVGISDRCDLSEDEWLAAMDGDSLEAGCDALLAAVRNFTRPLKRGMIDAGAAKIHQRYKQAIQAAERTIEAITTETTKAAIERLGMQQQIAQESSATSTSVGV